MNASILNYPGFQDLPKGVKQMLVVTEAYFFDEIASHHQGQVAMPQEMRIPPGSRGLSKKRLIINQCGPSRWRHRSQVLQGSLR
jgi:hypothetical protein